MLQAYHHRGGSRAGVGLAADRAIAPRPGGGETAMLVLNIRTIQTWRVYYADTVSPAQAAVAGSGGPPGFFVRQPATGTQLRITG